jgi:serine/threonine-protein phosphatase PGAM5
VSDRARHLYFVRHGQYEPSSDGGVLTGLGRKQARRTGKRLAAIAIDQLIASDLGRAVETAELIAGQLPAAPRARQLPLLREARPSAFPGIRIPLAERADGKRRVTEIVRRYFRPSRRQRHELFVCHGNLIRALASRCLGQSWTAWRDMDTSHCGVTRFEIRPDGRTLLRSYNETGHLPPAWVTRT